MNKSIMAMAVLSAMTTVAQAQGSSVIAYGIIDSAFVNSFKVATGNGRETGNLAAVNSGGLQASRIGFRGTEDLGGGLSAEFGLENGFATDNGAALQSGALFGRRSIVGLSSKQLGTLHLGRRKDFTDEIAGAYSSISPYSGFITAVHANNMDRIGGNRANNMIYYSTPTWSGLRANISYGFGETAGSITTGQSLGLGVNYDNGPFGIGFGYWQSRLGTSANPSSDQGAGSGAGCSTSLASNAGKAGQTCLSTWIIGSNYEFGALNVRGTYSEVRQPLLENGAGAAPNFGTTFSATTGTAAFTAGGANNKKAQIFDVGADYQLTPAVKLTGSFIQSYYDFISASNKGRLTLYIAGVQYSLSNRTTVYSTVGTQGAADMYNPGTGSGAPGADNRSSFMAAGVRHTF